MVLQLRSLAILEPSFCDLMRERTTAILEPLLHALDSTLRTRQHGSERKAVASLIESWRALAAIVVGHDFLSPVLRCAWPACGRTDVKLRVCSACGLMR